MITIVIPEQHHRYFDENNEEFYTIDVEETTLKLEHSLLSLKKWEENWKKPFLDEQEKSYEEILDYVRCMTLNEVRDMDVYRHIPQNLFDSIIDYVKEQRTATWFSGNQLQGVRRSRREKVTAEIIYYWMVSLGIPFEAQTWHLSQLLTLIRVLNIKNSGDTGKKVSKKQAARDRAKLNAQRRAMYNSKG